MALVEGFAERTLDRPRLHEPARCTYSIVEIENEKRLQLDTYGSRTREIPGKQSQSLQLDETSARELVRLIHATFPGSIPHSLAW